MIQTNLIDDFANRVSAALPDNLRRMHEDMDRNVKAAMESAFAKMDLVTREEFDIQQQVLARTREKLQALQARVKGLEG